MKEEKKNLFVICGGVSPEHTISVRSAKNILLALDRDKYDVRLIGISQIGNWSLLEESTLETTVKGGLQVIINPGWKDCFHTEEGSLGNVDVVFPILHGPNGEDGSIQGLLQLLNVPFVGPGVLGSSASMDKDVTKKLLLQEAIKVAKWRLIRRSSLIPTYEELAAELGRVLFVKPANMGSSVGVSRVTDESTWQKAISEALALDKKVLVEQLLEGRELECAVLGNESPVASGVGEVKSGQVYSFEEKYADSSSAQIIIPAEVSEEALVKLKETAVSAYQALECEGLARVDMFLSTTGEVFVNEINTMPGFTSISMYPKLWDEVGVSYSELLDNLIALAIGRD